jgi:hypothetical protein
MEFLCQTHRQGRRLAGYSCPGRATPLLNFYGVSPDLMPYIGELRGSLKLGKFVPGVHIPVVSSQRLVDDQPDFIVALAWHYAEAITDRLRREGIRSKVVTVLPELTVFDASIGSGAAL